MTTDPRHRPRRAPGRPGTHDTFSTAADRQEPSGPGAPRPSGEESIRAEGNALGHRRRHRAARRRDLAPPVTWTQHEQAETNPQGETP
jgi:hypothetical protein